MPLPCCPSRCLRNALGARLCRCESVPVFALPRPRISAPLRRTSSPCLCVALHARAGLCITLPPPCWPFLASPPPRVPLHPSLIRRPAVQSEHCRSIALLCRCAALPRQADASHCYSSAYRSLAVSALLVAGNCIAIASPSLLCRCRATACGALPSLRLAKRCRSVPLRGVACRALPPRCFAITSLPPIALAFQVLALPLQCASSPCKAAALPLSSALSKAVAPRVSP
jgi:hypothetical protein